MKIKQNIHKKLEVQKRESLEINKLDKDDETLCDI